MKHYWLKYSLIQMALSTYISAHYSEEVADIKFHR